MEDQKSRFMLKTGVYNHTKQWFDFKNMFFCLTLKNVLLFGDLLLILAASVTTEEEEEDVASVLVVLL